MGWETKSASIAGGCNTLSEKEKQTLRLIVRGHDAKSMARYLGLSVHTVNERLRDARRKLEVTSSREAARRLFNAEGAGPQSLVDNGIGEATAPSTMENVVTAGNRQAPPQRAALIITGAVIMSIILGLLALSALNVGTAPTVATAEAGAGGTPVAASESGVVRTARAWLLLGDQGRWNDGWLATAASFRNLNTSAQWAAAAEKARVPLGAVITRTALSQESVPTPPDGAEVVKFRTDFASRAGVIETVSLAREGTDWKVSGIYMALQPGN